MTLAELLALIAASINEMNELVAAHPEGMDEATAQKFDELEAKVEKLKADAERIKKLEAMNAENTQGEGRQTTAKFPAKAKEVDETSGFQSFGEFAMCVRAAIRNNDVDDRLKVLVAAPSNPHKESGSADGYMVPPAFASQVYELAFNEPDLLGMVDSEPTSSNQVQMIRDESTPWGSTGIQAYWGAEAGELQKSKLETKGESLKLHKLHAMVEVTDELMEDSPRLNERLSRGSARAINWKANEAILDGNGAGKPLGFRKGNGKVVVAKETDQAADTVNADNIAKMYSRMMNPSQAVWQCNQDVLPQLMTMTIGDRLIWTPPNEGFKAAPGGFLLGRPIMFSDLSETLGDEGDIEFINPMGYYLPKKQTGIKFSQSAHLYFDHDTHAFKWTFRLGGQPYLSKVVTPNKGSSTRAHFVRLAVRS